MLNAGLTIALAAATASLTEHPSTAAILTLGVTVGTWIVNFFAAVQGGLWERAAGYTPPRWWRSSSTGCVRLDVVLIALALIVGGPRRSRRSGCGSASPSAAASTNRSALGALAAAAIFACTLRHAELGHCPRAAAIRFPKRTKRRCAQIHAPLRIEVHLAPEDPRRVDLEHHALSKLRRVMPKLQVQYVSATSIGLFEQTSAALRRDLVRARRPQDDEPR